MNHHGGVFGGFVSWFAIVHDLDLTIIVLTNSRSYFDWIVDLRNQIIDYYVN